MSVTRVQSLRGFRTSVELELAVADIRNFQYAYMQLHKVEGIMVKYGHGGFAVNDEEHGGWLIYSGLELRNETDRMIDSIGPGYKSRKTQLEESDLEKLREINRQLTTMLEVRP